MLPCAAGGATLAYHFILIWDWQSVVGSRQSAQQEMASGQEARAAAAAAAAGMLTGSNSSWPLIRARKHVYSARPLAPLSATCQCLVLCLCVRLVSRPNLLFVCARNFAVLIIYLGGCPRGLDKWQGRGRWRGDGDGDGDGNWDENGYKRQVWNAEKQMRAHLPSCQRHVLTRVWRQRRQRQAGDAQRNGAWQGEREREGGQWCVVSPAYS